MPDPAHPDAVLPLAVPPARPRRLAYLGTPAMAVPPLEALVAAGFEVVLVVTRPDTRRGRGSDVLPSPVKAAATASGIPVSHLVDDVVDAGVDLAVVVAFGQLVRRRVLERVPMVNLHFSLLPRWRGAAPVERALLAGDAVTGVCLMRLEEGLDTGPVYAVAEVPVGDDSTGDEVRAALVREGTELLVRSLREGLGEPVPQHGEVTYAAKIDPAELLIDWTRPAADLHRLVRLGGAHTTFRGKRLKVTAAHPVPGDGGVPGALDGLVVPCGEGSLVLDAVQPEGRRPMPAADWLRGVRPVPDERLGA